MSDLISIILREHNPGGKSHDQKTHGRRGSNIQDLRSTLKKYGFSRDNPGGSWLEGEKKKAKEGKKRGRVTGTVTASSDSIPVSVNDLLKLPGERGEHLIRDDPARIASVQRLVKSIQQNGFDEDNGPLVWVDVDGEATVAEGNRRILAAKEVGLGKIPVQFRWFAGSEDVKGKWSVESIAQSLQD